MWRMCGRVCGREEVEDVGNVEDVRSMWVMRRWVEDVEDVGGGGGMWLEEVEEVGGCGRRRWGRLWVEGRRDVRMWVEDVEDVGG